MINLLKMILEGIGLGSLVVGGVALMITLNCIFGIIGIFVWPYVINSWLIFYGKTAQVVWWHGFLLGVVSPLGKLGIILALLTWIVLMFLR